MAPVQSGNKTRVIIPQNGSEGKVLSESCCP